MSAITTPTAIMQKTLSVIPRMMASLGGPDVGAGVGHALAEVEGAGIDGEVLIAAMSLVEEEVLEGELERTEVELSVAVNGVGNDDKSRREVKDILLV